MPEEFLRLAKKWFEGATELRQETLTNQVKKTPG